MHNSNLKRVCMQWPVTALKPEIPTILFRGDNITCRICITIIEVRYIERGLLNVYVYTLVRYCSRGCWCLASTMNQTVCGRSRGNRHRCFDFRESSTGQFSTRANTHTHTYWRAHRLYLVIECNSVSTSCIRSILHLPFTNMYRTYIRRFVRRGKDIDYWQEKFSGILRSS